MAKAKQRDRGVKLEVNGKVLDACTSLMQKIMQLIKDARSLQEEIKSKEKVCDKFKLIAQPTHAMFDAQRTSNPKEFYQRNHRWTEGLISAAKVVGHAAKLLV